MNVVNPRPVIGLTMGDPAGIGPEICLRALRDPAVLDSCVPVLFGDAGVIRRVREHQSFRPSPPQCPPPLPLPPKRRGGVWGGEGVSYCPSSSSFSSSKSLAKSRTRTRTRDEDENYRVLSLVEWGNLGRVEEPLMVDCGAIDTASIKPGEISAACGKAGYIYIEHAIRAAMKGKISGVVTAPIHKEALHLAGVKHPGHTEIFTALTGAKRSCMMLYSDKLTVSMVTTHIGYRDVPGKLSIARVLDVIELTAEAMRWMLHREPRIGVCGLNPHAGEHGLFGQREEENFVEPAVATARARKIDVQGPLVPDAAFTTAQRKKFDAMVTLYHDQGHIPFKMLAFDTGVNITLGLPMIRTSVDHGTAFDIAWKGKADPQSLFSAIRVAVELAAGKKMEAIP